MKSTIVWLVHTIAIRAITGSLVRHVIDGDGRVRVCRIKNWNNHEAGQRKALARTLIARSDGQTDGARVKPLANSHRVALASLEREKRMASDSGLAR